MSAQWNSLDIALMTTTDICFSPPTLLHKFSSAFHFQWCLTTHTRFITARSGEGWDGKFKFLSIFLHPHPPHQLTEQSHPKDSTVASPHRMLEFLSTELETIYIKLIHFLFEIFTVSNGFPNSSNWSGREKNARWKSYNSWSVAAEKHRLNLNWARRFFFD